MSRMAQVSTDIVDLFDAGLTSTEIARHLGIPLLMVEDELHRLEKDTIDDLEEEEEFSFFDHRDNRMVGDEEEEMY